MKGRLLDAIELISLSGVGSSQSAKLSKIGINNLQDLLLHLPARYEDRTRQVAIADLQAGMAVTVSGQIQNCSLTFGSKRMLVCTISDGTGILTLRFFHFNAGMKNSLITGKTITAFGEIRRGQYGAEIIHPEYQLSPHSTTRSWQETLTPIYPTTDGIRQTTLRKLTDQALEQLKLDPVAELLPVELNQGLMPVSEAIALLHRPPPAVELQQLNTGRHPAQQRLITEELLAHNLSMLAIRAGLQREKAFAVTPDHSISKRLLANLPFQPTQAQLRVVREIEQDLMQAYPMLRLVQGDVGSGKTLVAALAALNVIASGYQVALMAPTELLAEQHVANFRQWFAPLGLEVGFIAGKQKGKAREATQQAIVSGQIKMIVGTHALFQEQIQFQQLSLIIIDEQHRFGVHQRLALRSKGQQQGYQPHQLIMTATPIPRTLAMTAYADLDSSIIDELPPGRSPVTTVAIPDSRRQEIIERIRAGCQQGHQAYWVCTLIEESEQLAAQAAEVTWQFLQTQLPEIQIGLVHGRMKAAEKQQVMQQFKDNQLQLLVATTVIEVGVDVPNASMMIIENSERLGLAQLHQLRGRVGRGAVASHCVLLYHPPLGSISRQRLQVLRQSQDGFVIAQKDLEIRGPGELTGIRQTGNARFKIADLLRDQAMIPDIQRIARYLHQYYPEQAQALIERWLPESENFINA